MGRKPKAGGAEGKRTDPEQSARFLEAARQVGVDETGEGFERAFEKIASPTPRGSKEQGGEQKPATRNAGARKRAR